MWNYMCIRWLINWWESSVSALTANGQHELDLISGRSINVYCNFNIRTSSTTHPAPCLKGNGTSLRMKRPECEVDPFVVLAFRSKSWISRYSNQTFKSWHARVGNLLRTTEQARQNCQAHAIYWSLFSLMNYLMRFTIVSILIRCSFSDFKYVNLSVNCVVLQSLSRVLFFFVFFFQWHICMYKCVLIYIYLHLFIYLCIYKYVYICVCICAAFFCLYYCWYFKLTSGCCDST